ncbi:MAG: lipid II flippase MurJ, partial [Bacteroidota bacterium]
QLQLRLWAPYTTVATPLLLHLLIGNSVEYIDGLIVTSYFPDEGAFAVFRYGARELPLTTLLVGAVVTAMIPVASRSLGQGMQEIRSKTLRLSHWLFPLSAVLMLLSPWLFPFVYNADFQESAIVFNWYLLILGTRILLPQVLLIAKGHNYFLVISAIIETLVNVGLSLWWVRSYGLGGIAAASVVANLINKLNMMIYCRWQWGIRPGQYIALPWYFSYLALLIVAYIISDQWWNLAS